MQYESSKQSVGTQVSPKQIEEDTRAYEIDRKIQEVTTELKNLNETVEIRSFNTLKGNNNLVFYHNTLIETEMIPEDKISWSVMWLDYRPKEYIDQSVVRDNMIDNESNIETVLSEYEIVDDRPLNPCGRTGFAFMI